MEEIKCNQIGRMTGGKWDKLHDMSRRVYGIDGLSPTLHTAGGGNTEPKILIPEPTKKGYDIATYGDSIIATYGDSINMAFPTSKTRRGRVGHGVAQTLTAQDAQQAVVEPFAYDEQNGYIRQDGTVGTLTTDGSSPKHNNRIIEPNLKDYKIRKLTERECFRLMGVKASDFEKVRKNQSMSGLYHLAGDSIVTACLMAICGMLFGVDYNQKITELVIELQGENL